MGLDINMVQFLIDARKGGARFGEMLTIGRQQLNVYPARMVQLLRKHGLPHEAFLTDAAQSQFAEPCFQALGVKQIYSLDASDFEGASFVHDLNRPLPADLKNRFDTVFDGGTLEHVFNFPVAIQNCMEMLRVGGRFFIHTCANNLCGHGFYQFSPELFYRIFSPENGFEVERIVLHRVGPYGRWYEVPDPNQIRSRIELITFTPIHLMVQARRTKVVPIFSSMPQQSDYMALWQEGSQAKHLQSKGASSTGRWLQRTLPGLARFVNVIKTGIEFYSRQSFRNRKCFHPVRRP